MKTSWAYRLKHAPVNKAARLQMERDCSCWNTCAVGEACGFPTAAEGRRIAETVSLRDDMDSLAIAANDFTTHVMLQRYDEALEQWKRIQNEYKYNIDTLRKMLRESSVSQDHKSTPDNVDK